MQRYFLFYDYFSFLKLRSVCVLEVFSELSETGKSSNRPIEYRQIADSINYSATSLYYVLGTVYTSLIWHV